MTTSTPTSNLDPTKQYSPGLEGIVAGESTISRVDPDIDSLMYRGFDVRDLCTKGCYEEAAYVLLYGHLPNVQELKCFKETLAQEASLPQVCLDTLRALPKTTHPMDALRTGVSILASFDPQTEEMSHEANLAKAVRLLAKMPTIITSAWRFCEGKEAIQPLPELSLAENFFYTLFGEKPDALTAKAFDTSLILYAEHGFNASTFCGRVAVSTLSDMHSGICAAIGTLKGPLHGGANEEAMKMLLEIGDAENAEAWIMDALATKKKIMGFGHRVYKNGDTRAPILKKLGRELCDAKGEGKWADMAAIVEAVMMREKNIHPNVDFPTSYIYYVMGLPIHIYTPIFAAARLSGWAAHIIEQLDHNRLIRPKSLYNGPGPQQYVPLADR